MTREKQKFGIEGHTFELEVKTSSDRPRAWDGDAKLAVVGTPEPRIDGAEKVTGRAAYTTDVRLPDMLYAEVIRSPHPCAVVKRITTTRAEKMPGVRAIHFVAVSGSTLRYEGQEILAIAADTLLAARDAADAVWIDYLALPHVTDVASARRESAPFVHLPPTGWTCGKPDVRGNVRGPITKTRQYGPSGDVEEGLGAAYAKVRATFETQVQTHSCLEPHAAVVRTTEEGGFEIWTSTQSISSVISDVAAAFGVAKSKVRVHCDFLGGGFGSKLGPGSEVMIAAHLARATKRPVRLVFDRRAEHLAGGNRPSSIQDVRLGAEKSGKLTAIEVESFGTGGVATGAGVAAPFYNIYACANRASREHDVFTHGGPAKAFRAPGHPHGVFALEGSIDALAAAIGMDPIDFRLANDDHPTRREQWKIARERFRWDEKRRATKGRGPIVRGVGCASSVWYNFVERGVGATVAIFNDGSIQLSSAVQDIGGGIRTVIAQVAAEVLGVSAKGIDVRIGDSSFPVGPSSGGSTTTASLTPAVHHAAWEARKKLAKIASEALGGDPERVAFRDGKVLSGERSCSFTEACQRMRVEKIEGHGEREKDDDGIRNAKEPAMQQLADRIAGVQMAEVAVDVETGIVRVEHILAVHDCGRVMNPLLARSQVNGGVIQGIGYALFEERALDPITGRMLNANLESYRIVGMREVPDIDVVFTNVYTGLSSTGALGLGEPATVPTAAAIANAIFHATGRPLRRLPMTPDVVLAALKVTS